MLREIQPQRLTLGEGVVNDAVVALDVAGDVIRRVTRATADGELLQVIVDGKPAVDLERADRRRVAGTRVHRERARRVESALARPSQETRPSEPLRNVRARLARLPTVCRDDH